jgi:hypothetical protein
MTFLEYVCFKLLGPPTHSHNNGESTWPCPRCGHPRFHTLPAVAGYRDRFRCWRCPFRGDEYDLLKHLRPRENFDQRKARLAALREEYDRGAAAGGAGPGGNGHGNGNGPGGPFPFPGTGMRRPPDPYGREPMFDEFGPAPDAAAAELMEGLANLEPAVRWEALAACEQALALCARYALHPLGLSGRCSYERWVGKANQDHMDECRDPDCDWGCCRARRGLPPVPLRDWDKDPPRWRSEPDGAAGAGTDGRAVRR